jgi:hypothetical protein
MSSGSSGPSPLPDRLPYMGHARCCGGRLASRADQANRQRCTGCWPSASDRRQRPQRCRRSAHCSCITPLWTRTMRRSMSETGHFDVLVLGSGQGGKPLAWHIAQAGRCTAVVKRRWVGGSFPNISCMPSKNEIWGDRPPCAPRRPLAVTTRLPPIWRAYGNVNARWSSAKLRSISRSTNRPAPS